MTVISHAPLGRNETPLDLTYTFIDADADPINLTGAMWINFAAAYSDYHVSGLNPAGNACLADLAFVASRFRIVQRRRPLS